MREPLTGAAETCGANGRRSGAPCPSETRTDTADYAAGTTTRWKIPAVPALTWKFAPLGKLASDSEPTSGRMSNSSTIGESASFVISSISATPATAIATATSATVVPAASASVTWLFAWYDAMREYRSAPAAPAPGTRTILPTSDAANGVPELVSTALA